MTSSAYAGLDLFRKTVLSKFVTDLKEHNWEQGFNRPQCERVTDALTGMVTSLYNLPDMHRAKRKVIADAQFFLVAYSDWNGAEGATDDAKEARRRKALRLKKRRDRFSKAIRLHKDQLENEVAWSIVREMYSSLDNVVKELPELFPLSRAELSRFEKACSPHW